MVGGRLVTREDFLEKYYSIIKTALDEKGIWPSPALGFDGENFSMYSYCLNSYEILRQVSVDSKVKEFFVVGIDRHAKDEQGTALDSVFTCLLFENEILIPFIVEYNSSTLEVLPINFDNKFWNQKIIEEYKTLKEGLS